MTFDATVLLQTLSLTDMAQLSGALVLGALLGWDIRARNAAPDARIRQASLAVLAFLSALGVMALLRGGASWMVGAMPAAQVIVPLAATALLVLAGTTVLMLLRPAGDEQIRLRDAGFSIGFAMALGLACGAGLPHVAIVIVPAALLFLNLMRWTPPATG
ncbi:MAG: hypothetical protein AAF321_01960, partial [Pseudomonadota bacterium]